MQLNCSVFCVMKGTLLASIVWPQKLKRSYRLFVVSSSMASTGWWVEGGWCVAGKGLLLVFPRAAQLGWVPYEHSHLYNTHFSCLVVICLLMCWPACNWPWSLYSACGNWSTTMDTCLPVLCQCQWLDFGVCSFTSCCHAVGVKVLS